METLRDFLPFVKDQAEFHEKQAQKYRADPKRYKLHSATSQRFKQLSVIIESTTQDSGVSLSETPSGNDAGLSNRALNITSADIVDLPQELIIELRLTESDQQEFAIVNLVDALGGVASLDRILIDLYRKTGEIIKRTALTAKLYRMTQKKLLFAVPGRKGIYSTKPASQEGSSV